MARFIDKNIPLLFYNQCITYSDRPCVAFKKDGKYLDISWKEMRLMTLSLANFLKKKGIRKGDKIAIFSPTRFQWWVADQATLLLGAITVPIYSTNSTEEALYILENSESKICFTGEKEHFDKIIAARRKYKECELIIPFAGGKKGRGVTFFADALREGYDENAFSALDAMCDKTDENDIATIIYTSGTTGNPKGVMLTHKNIMSNVKNVMTDLDPYFDESDVFLSFLPLSHVLERIGYYVAVSIGAKTAMAEDISTLLENLIDVRPSVLISVPRIYEKMHAGILSKARNASIIKKAILAFATSTAAKNLPYVCRQIKRPFLFSIAFSISNKLVYSKLLEKIGLNKLKFAISGGGPLSVTDAEFFVGMGLQILEGFGLTETSPITHLNRPGEIKIGSCGRPINETEVVISNEGEILIRGPQVMKGYYKDPVATREVFDGDGFFHTGDIGRTDADGKLFITGRMKDIIVTSGGKNISPQNIENLLKASPYIEQVALIGDRRKFVSGLIVPSFNDLEKWAKQNSLEWNNREDLLSLEKVRSFFEKEIDRLTSSCSRVEKIKRFALLPNEWTQDGGELTPSQKVKRRVIEEKYKDIIESIYTENGEPM